MKKTGDEEGLITFNPREETGIIANPIDNIEDPIEDTGIVDIKYAWIL